MFSDQQDAVVLYLLQLLINCSPPSMKKKKKKIDVTVEEGKKYSTEEIRRSFIYNVKVG